MEGDVTRVWPIEGWWGIRRLSRPGLFLGKVDSDDLQTSKLSAAMFVGYHLIDRLTCERPAMHRIIFTVPRLAAEVEQSIVASGTRVLRQRTDRIHVYICVFKYRASVSVKSHCHRPCRVYKWTATLWYCAREVL